MRSAHASPGQSPLWKGLVLLAYGLLASLLARGASPPPKPTGSLIGVGDRKLHLFCQGTGSPAVILESGAGEFSIDWALTQPLIAKVTRVCAYDRAGYAWSDMSGGFEQFPAVAGDMQDLLRNAGIEPPYVLVGHAFGALYARDYQRRFPEQVAGLALVDPTPEQDAQVVMFGNTVSLLDMADHDLRAFPVRPFAPSRTSPPPRKPAAGQRVGPPFDILPPDLQNARQWALEGFFGELDGLGAEQALAVMESQRATFTDLYNARHDPAVSPLKLPVIVLSRGRDTTPEIQQMQDDLGRLSRDAIHRIVAGSGTQIHIDQPGVVASAVAEVVSAIRTGRPLSPNAPSPAKP
jgi:pimeloyl-ACP methyl ester carboxylesterase